VAYVALAPIVDPALVLPTIGRSVGMGPVEGLDVETLVTEHLRPLSRLLVLDNFEHLADAAPQIARLVAACPHLTVLVASRAALRVRGETEYPVSPLALPPGGAPDPAQVAASPACSLFLDRARSVAPGFALTGANAAAVAAICRRLAGIPLALELAAARTRVLDPEALLARLDEAMARGGARDLPERQQTMRATLDWSHGLLRPEEQRLFRRLSVFTGGFTLDAAEAVAGDADGEADVLGLLEGLVEQSLVVVRSDQDGRLRYGMLEPIAQYARSVLEEPEATDAGRAHAASSCAWPSARSWSTSAPTRSSGCRASTPTTATCPPPSSGRSTTTTPRRRAAWAGRSGSSGGCAGGSCSAVATWSGRCSRPCPARSTC
jgi:predicted ATPase